MRPNYHIMKTDIGIIDIEASGLHFDSYPIEIAILRQGICKSWLIKPEKNWTYWCETAESLHGIKRRDLYENGLSACDVAHQINEFLSDSDTVLYSDANRWDDDWVSTLYFAAKIERNFYVDSIYDLIDKEKWHEFDAHKALLAESGRFRHHRAAEDVRMINEALLQVLNTDSTI